MSVATEILSLRQNQSSSVKTLLAAIEWEKAAQEEEHILSRGYAVREAADIVLLNVAVHAAEALSEPPVIRRTRRSLLSFWRKPRRANPGELHQRSARRLKTSVAHSSRSWDKSDTLTCDPE